jgi:hypothetical protein
VATTSPLSPAENAELDRLQTRLRVQLLRAGRTRLAQLLDEPLFALFVRDVPGIDHAAAARISQLDDRVRRNNGCRCAIVAVPGGRAAARG